MSMFYNVSFKDPATVYAYSLIFVHHQVMWFMFIILGVVYWSFYKIVKEYNWNSFNKQAGLFYTLSYANDLIIQIDWVYTGIVSDALYLITSKYLIFNSKFWMSLWLKYWEVMKYRSWLLPLVLLITVYHAWARITLTLETLTNYYYKRSQNKDNNFLLQRGIGRTYLELILNKYYYYSTYSRANNAYIYSIYSKEDKDFLTVQSYRDNLFLELIWAFFPSLIIFLILIPSLYLLYSLEEDIQPKFNIKVIGHQWFWSYEFDSVKYDLSFEFDSTLILESDLDIGGRRLLEVSNRLYLPVNVPLRILVTSSDVLHSWAVPEMGIKVDAVPGRLNDCVTLIRRPGVFYGQCSELCGVGHGFMPIVVEAVSYKKWMDIIASL